MYIKITRPMEDDSIILEAESIHYWKYFDQKVEDLRLTNYSVYWSYTPNEKTDFILLTIFKNKSNELAECIIIPHPFRMFIMNNDGKTIDSIYMDYQK